MKTMTRWQRKMIGPSLGVLVIMGACADLDIANVNEPDRERSLAQPADIEALAAGTFRLWWQVNHGLGAAAETRPATAAGALSSLAEEATSSAAHYGVQNQGFIPRQPILNDAGASWDGYVESTWQELYKVLAATREALIALEQPGFQVGPGGRDNPRLRAYAKWMQGMALGTLGLIYREAFVLDEGVAEPELPNLELRPYGQVMAAGLRALAAAREIASANSFVIPAEWTGGVTYRSSDLVRISNSYSARFMAGVARNPTERAGVDWAALLRLAEEGVTQDFGVEADGPGGRWQAGIRYDFSTTGRRVSMEIVGPADQSGAWQTWRRTPHRVRNAVTIETDDRRIHGAGGPATPGTQVQRYPTAGMDASRGLWYFSLYGDLKHAAYKATRYGFLADMPVRELDFLKAEAHIRLGDPAAAAELINRTRVTNGRLPALTAEGPTGNRCLPRKPNGACGSLMDALKYEKGLELWHFAMGVRFSDRRGWGDLQTGSALHLPVPIKELLIAGLPVYTTGGVGGLDAAPERQ